MTLTPADITAILALIDAGTPTTGEGFPQPIVAGQNLLIPAVQSPNFLTGVTGWQLNKTGSAEFNNLTIRGTFNGTDFIINSIGAFFYDGVPATGNLIISNASSAGTDSFGNVFSGPGVFVYAGALTSGLSAGTVSMANAADTFTLAADPTLDQLLLSCQNGNAELYFLPAFVQVTGAPLRVDQLFTYGAGSGGGGSTTLTFTSSTTWTAPAGVTSVNVEAWAGGGGGASSAGSGGGGGEYAAEHANSCTPGNTYTITIGGSGPAGAGGGSSNGGSGGNSQFSGTGATTVLAHGGGGGNSAGSPGGAGGSGSANSTHHNGGTGGTSTGGAHGGGGGAGGGGSSFAGGNGQNAASGGNAPGSGGSGGVSGGAGGSGGGWGGSSPTTGGSATTQGGGGGGGGGWDGASNQKAGGTGSKGYIKITFTVSGAAASFAAVAGVAGSDVSGNAFAAGYTGATVAVQPSSSPAVVETWHNVTPPTGWSGVCRYKMLAETNMVIVDIQCTHAGASGNITFMTLPAGYRPVTLHSNIPSIGNNTAPANANQRIDFNTTGAVTTFALPASTTQVKGTWIFPID